MPNITFIHPDGRSTELKIAEGVTLMQGATVGGIDEIVAECGGNALCATCHVYVDEDKFSLIPPPSEHEDALLDGVAAERRPSSRLSCQIVLTSELDGLIVHLPIRQVC